MVVCFTLDGFNTIEFLKKVIKDRIKKTCNKFTNKNVVCEIVKMLVILNRPGLE